ncbi:hypothetical protein ABE073_04665 [Lederbergia citrisecunda]|uniref:hypothetical protein n=1 Tax=Lederbergia citrisecunda TaxID=2833583 RepID=UPI003D2A22FC
MVKVIETNLSLNSNDERAILDHQGRVIEVESWESYVEELFSGETVYRKALFGDKMEGYSLPVDAIIDDFKSDEYHLSYHATTSDRKYKCLAYLINE